MCTALLPNGTLLNYTGTIDSDGPDTSHPINHTFAACFEYLPLRHEIVLAAWNCAGLHAESAWITGGVLLVIFCVVTILATLNSCGVFLYEVWKIYNRWDYTPLNTKNEG